jgi:RNA polymerase sigma-70 factor, ECF subfamily
LWGNIFSGFVFLFQRSKKHMSRGYNSPIYKGAAGSEHRQGAMDIKHSDSFRRRAVLFISGRSEAKNRTTMSRTSSISSHQNTGGIEYISSLYSYAMVLTRNRAEAEDLVQETYVRAIGAMGNLRGDSNVKSWLFTILRNVWLNQLRKRRTTPEMVAIDVEENAGNAVVETSRDPHAVYVSKVEQQQVREAIQQLPTDFREIILLREYEELSYQEIASILDCPPGTVMSRLARARSKLRKLLSAVAKNPDPPERRDIR